jgi:4-amino-4-deoxy-L-arabinose transferase-like glycosyltransferase
VWIPRAAALAVFAASFVWLQGGAILFTPQSLSYVVAAGALLEGRGLAIAPGTPLANFGPLYALLLAVGRVLGLGVVPSAYLVNCAVLAGSLLAIRALGRRLRLPAPGWLAAGFGVWAANWTLLRAARPDLLVVGLSLAAVAAVLRYRDGGEMRALLAAAALASLAALGRYMAAFTLLPVLLAAVWLFAGADPPRRRLRHAALFALLAAGPVASWMARNWALTGFVTGMSRTGERAQAAGTSLAGNLAGFSRTLALDVFGVGAMGVRPLVYDGVAPPHPGLGAALALVCAALLALAVVTGWRARRRGEADAAAAPGLDRSGLALVAACGGWYCVALVVLWTVGNNDPIDTRYVAPAEPYLLVAGFAGFAALRGSAPRSPWPRRALLLAGLALLLVQLHKSAGLLQAQPDPALLGVESRHQKIDRWLEDVPWSR